jgi:hypothetical protein
MRVPDAALKSVVYLGQGTAEDFHAVGTGFLVDLRRVPGGVYYLITADHVAQHLKSQFAIRFNDKAGNSHVQQSQSPGYKWWRHPTDNVDAAVFPWGLQGGFATFPVERFISDVNLDLTRIGIGDEVFIVGLFRKWAGYKTVMPIVRHGHIAMMAGEPIPTKNYGKALMHLIEAFSLQGLSGAPVIARQTIGVPFRPRNEFEPENVGTLALMFLLGLVHGYYPIQEGRQVWHTGISMVVPSTKILEILNQPELIEYERWVAGLLKKKKDVPNVPVGTSIEESTDKPKRKSRVRISNPRTRPRA